MRAFLLVAFVWLIGAATAGTVCLTCNDLNYDCVPLNYVYDGCPVDPTTCPFPSCTTHCQGLYGANATGSCSTSLFTCICDTGAANVPDVTTVPSTAPGTKSASTGGVTVAVVDPLAFSTVSLGTDGTVTTGTGATVALVLVAVVCMAVILAIAAYVSPSWIKNGRKNGIDTFKASFVPDFVR